MSLQNIQTDIPVVQQVDALITHAIRQAASDIHGESTLQGLRIRYRIDGILYDQGIVPFASMSHVIARIKVLAHINIADRRVPHDGKLSVTIRGKIIDLRVSTFPSLYGEKFVIRILDRSKNSFDLPALGFDEIMLEQFKTLLKKASGFFLVTGPTGSGKTTTLYGALAWLNSPEKNIITLEDPIEYTVDGITQGQIHPEAGFTFEKGIRAVLRQDPDIAMVGEIRDRQTAQIAIEAALTGHVVLSTLHTNDAASVIMRLMDMGIEPFLINAAVSGVLAQRLARKICQGCRVEKVPDEYESALLKKMSASLELLYRGAGCLECNGLGFKGRVGIFELLVMNNKLRALIGKQPSHDALHEQALSDGMKTLTTDGLEKVRAGIITLGELMRVVG